MEDNIFVCLQKQYLQFIGGIKLREALHRFQKETMTDELTSQFTYWGRTADSIPFHNTKIAKVFFRKCYYGFINFFVLYSIRLHYITITFFRRFINNVYYRN